MNILVLLSLAAAASCAPVGEQVQTIEQVAVDDVKVKRAKEFMMYEANENNKPKEKRSDPFLDEGSKVETEGPIDIVAPVQEEEEELKAESSVTDEASRDDEPEEVVVESPVVEEEMLNEVEDELQSAEESEEAPLEIESDAVIGSEEIPETALVVEDEKINSNNDDGEPNLDLNEDESTYMQKYLSLYDQLGGRTPGHNVPYWSPMSYFAKLGSRYRRNTAGVVGKGNRRIKRDLWDDLAAEYEPYELEEYERDSYSPEEWETLLDILDNARAYEEAEEEREMEEEEEEEKPWGLGQESALKPYLLEGEPGYFVPAKRQAGLSFVPGVKRNNYFYPISREPESHFGAFVPEKRGMSDFDSEYERLMQLAAALQDQEEYARGPYDLQDWQYVYRRK